MPLAVRILTPVRVDAADIARRTARYRSAAGPDVRIEVSNLEQGPLRLATCADLEASDRAALDLGRSTDPGEFDAILFDCVFDRGLDPLRLAVSIPVFGPMSFALSAMPQIATRFSVIVRTEAHRELLRESLARNGEKSRLRRIDLLGLSDEESRDAVSYDRALAPTIARLAAEDPSQAVILGSTTMDITPAIRAVAARMRLVHPSLFTLDAISSLWRNRALPPR